MFARSYPELFGGPSDMFEKFYEHPLPSAFAILCRIPMATRRWIGELEAWMRAEGLSKEEVAKRSNRSTQHVIALFKQREPNPTLKVYLDVVDAAGARIKGVSDNSPVALIARLRELRDREGISNVKLAHISGVNRPQLSTLFNSPDPNPKLAMVDAIVTALGVEEDITMVACTSPRIQFALAAGERAQANVEAAQGVVDSTRRHLEVVEAVAPAMEAAQAERTIASLRTKLETAEKDLVRAKERCEQQAETIEKLKQEKLALEKQRADSDARWRRINKEAQRQAEEREEEQNKRIAELEARPQWTTLQVAGIGVAGVAAGAAAGVGIAALIQRLRS